jgi:hypothetical protein
VWSFGAGCEFGHAQGTPPTPTKATVPGLTPGQTALARGFLVATSSMTEYGQHCNDVTSAQSVMTLKEYIVESYGDIRYTIGQGCSGGSHQLNLIASNYPGLLDGILPMCAFQDTWTPYREFSDRALMTRYFQMLRDTGTAANQAIWREPGPLLPPPALLDRAFLTMDAWLARVEADHSNAPRQAKVLRDKPAEAVDSCFPDGAHQVVDPAGCKTAFRYVHADTRVAAGAPPTSDVLQCRLRPLDRAGYRVAFTDAQWTRLRATFPTGVCDYSVPGVGQQPPAGPWQTFTAGPGGSPLGPPPSSIRVG